MSSMKNDKLIDDGKMTDDLKKLLLNEKKHPKLKSQKCYSVREILLKKALAKQKKIAEEWCDELQATNIHLQKSNEKLHHYKLANKGEFEMAVEAEVSRRLRELCQPLGKAVQINLNNVVCMLKSLSELKSLVATLSSHTYLTRPTAMHTHNSIQKTTTVKRRSHVVHPMVKGLVLHPATINIPRVAMSGQQSCILRKPAPKRKKLEVSSSNDERRPNIVVPVETYDSSDVEGTVINNSQLNNIQTPNDVLENDDTCENKKSEVCDSNSPTEDTTSNSAAETIIAIAARPVLKEDPLEGPSWLYNGGKRKIGQNRKVVLDRLKQGTKAPFEYRVYIDSSSDTEKENKQATTKPRKKRMKCEPKVKKSLENVIPREVRRGRQKKIICTRCPQPVNTDMSEMRLSAMQSEPCSKNESCGAPDKLPSPRNCSVVLIREQDMIGATRTSDSETPSDKENIPPVPEPTVEINGEEVKLRSIAVVIEDIMKNHGLDLKKYKLKAKKVPAKKTRKINGTLSTSLARVHCGKKARSKMVSKSNRNKLNLLPNDNKNGFSRKVNKKMSKSNSSPKSSDCCVLLDNKETKVNQPRVNIIEIDITDDIDILTTEEKDPLAI